MSLKEQLRIEKPGYLCKVEEGAVGTESSWIPFDELRLTSGKLILLDPISCLQSGDGLVIGLPSARYGLEARVMDYGDDKRISRLKLVQDVPHELGELLGTTFADVGYTGACDHEALLDSVVGNEEAAEKLAQEVFEIDEYGKAALSDDPEAVMHVVSSGFGDGEFPVRELISESRRIGVEVEFIEAGAPYPL